MYVIGKSDSEFIKIVRRDALFDGINMWYEIKRVAYNTPLSEATIISNREDAISILKEIQHRARFITFSDNSINDGIFGKPDDFDNVSYSQELVLFELVPLVSPIMVHEESVNLNREGIIMSKNDKKLEERVEELERKVEEQKSLIYTLVRELREDMYKKFN